MSDEDSHIWDDFNHYMHTGELAEYFEDDYEENGEEEYEYPEDYADDGDYTDDEE